MSLPTDDLLSSEAPEPMIQSMWWRWLLPLIVLLTAYGMQRSVALLGLDLHHDTLMFDAARRTLNGDVPFRDFFYQYNLGTIFLHVLALKFFGLKIASLKTATAISYALIALLIYACGAVLGRRWWAFCAALIWSTLSPFYMPVMNGYHAWSTVYMMASVMGGALFLMMSLSGRPLLWSILAGVCLNLAFWFKQVAGLQILLVLAWIAYNAWRPAAGSENVRRFRIMFVGYALGGLVSALPFFFYLQEQSLFQDWWRSAFVFNGFFAASGNSVSGVMAFAKTLFPVARDMGYVSVVWGLMPLCLLAIVLMPDPSSRERLFSRTDTCSIRVSLFAALGIAGWIEYFPLAHAFHTQLFMAPVFVMLVFPYDDSADKGRSSYRRNLITWLLILTVSATVYEAVRHMNGLRIKITEPWLVLSDDTPVNGLSLKPEHARSFESFYGALLRAKREAGGLPLIPMSVDPLRGLLLNDYHEPAVFKMGVDWTWPNELIEPGFNKQLVQRIAERKSPIYADSLIAIPGYAPVALLEMPSPITDTHTLYIPSADQTVTEPQARVVHDVLYLNGMIMPLVNSIVEQPNFISFFLGNLEGVPVDDIDQIHVSIFRPEDAPRILSKFQYENFITAIPSEASAKVAKLYERKSNGGYMLKHPLDHEQGLDMAKFMLSRGKLFEQQNFPIYFTTLSSSRNRRPFLVKISAGEPDPRLAWAKHNVVNSLSIPAVRHISNKFYLAIPEMLDHADETMFFAVQITMNDRTTRNFYLDYLPK